MNETAQHTPEALELFERAAAKLRVALDWMQRYNDVACALNDLGYQFPCAYSFSGIDPIGEDADFYVHHDGPGRLQEYFDAGPHAKERRRNQYLQTLSYRELLAELGKESCWTCVYCQKSGAPEHGPDGRSWHLDHGFPRALGGDDHADNKILACATCNIRKNKKTASAVLNQVLEKLGRSDV